MLWPVLRSYPPVSCKGWRNPRKTSVRIIRTENKTRRFRNTKHRRSVKPMRNEKSQRKYLENICNLNLDYSLIPPLNWAQGLLVKYILKERETLERRMLQKSTQDLVWKRDGAQRSLGNRQTGGKGNWIEQACTSSCFICCNTHHIIIQVPRLSKHSQDRLVCQVAFIDIQTSNSMWHIKTRTEDIHLSSRPV